VVQLITKLRELSERCVADMRINQEMTISREDKKQVIDSNIYVSEDSQQIVTK
jgi:hypothetical protein